MRDSTPEDIISKLEALRKRGPEEEGPPPRRENEGRKKLARVIGILVIILILCAIFLTVYKLVFVPKKIEEQKKIEEIKAKQAALQNEKQKKISEIKEAFAGLPSNYQASMYELIGKVEKATSSQEVNSIDYESSATQAWREYLLDKLENLLATTQNVKLKVDGELYREPETIRMKISTLPYTKLKEVELGEVKFEYVPIRLPREQAAEGLANPGDYINIYYRENENVTKCIVRDARIVVKLLGKVEEISLTEEKEKYETGGGVEGYGTVPSLSIGTTNPSISGELEGSAGLKRLKSYVTYSVDINEVLKAIAAGQLPEEVLDDLRNYGIKLTTQEIETGIAELDTEYIYLLEMSDEEAPVLISKLLDDKEKSKIYATISKTPSWAF